MGIVAIFDSRYKIKLLEFYYLDIYDRNYDLKIENIKNICYELLMSMKKQMWPL